MEGISFFIILKGIFMHFWMKHHTTNIQYLLPFNNEN